MNENLKDLVPSLSREERIKTLSDSVATLKSEFIGLSDIIDEIKNAVSPWYITPEIIERPVIVSLWGMTGTGKSSVVNRLLELLKVSERTTKIDCGEDLSDGKLITKLQDILGIDEDSQSPTSSLCEISQSMCGINNRVKHSVFVFDEFQYARTIDEDSREVDKKDTRYIWHIIDSGKLEYNTYSYRINKFNNFTDDFTSLKHICPDIVISNNRITDNKDKDKILEEIGFWYSEEHESPTLSSYLDRADNKKEDKPLIVISYDNMQLIRKRLNSFAKGLGTETVNKLITGTYTVTEFGEELDKIRNILTKPVNIDCSGALVFLIGNLDEAYHMCRGANPDLDADIFYDMSSKVTISDIKDALRARFRQEQIARFGNNIIKYPTLNKDCFHKLVGKEIDRVLDLFKKIAPDLTIEVTQAIKELLFSEGVYPTQGVRPVFTTIESMLTPYLSKILTDRNDIDKNIVIDLRDYSDWTDRFFKVDKTEILIRYIESNRENVYRHKLVLGSYRSPEKRKTRYINSVHEAGHAVMLSYLYGIAPLDIVSVSVDGGGFCVTYDKGRDGEISSRYDIDANYMISVGGYLSEELIYKDRPEMRLLGSSQDLLDAWNSFSEAAYKCGYFYPAMMSSYSVDKSIDGLPNGNNSETEYVTYYDGKEVQKNQFVLTKAIRKRTDELVENTKKILSDERELIINLSRYLGKFGSIRKDKYLEFVKEYGNKLTLDFMNKQKEKYSESYYRDALQ